MARPNPLKWAFQVGEYAPRPVVPPRPAEFGAPVSREPALVRVYDPSGISALVRPEEVPGWEAKGFRVTRRDLRQVLRELDVQFSSAKTALGDLVAAALIEGHFDASDDGDLAVAQRACADVANGMLAILSDVQLGYPVIQGVGVQMLNPEGETLEVDPNQVALFRKKGWSEVPGE